ncbi:MAG: hypothetical protein A2309_09945 [Bacteroidetes bacterium RIFOXYB2_FULL_35_7]|nr:MAG: hypothetical protein A2X01_06615 [Bacteroidetes bacterium GWF2_35_48]OFY93606.1 MAG: hypothetical protein A2491_01040 [Bacteroidetes bacterium RIFOXYC12_FULL_35_7]OFY94181.1 MAG: hypothetical protein A2309_09945 [Bacteroidetes bacterium RIFOXYB2_FULL_35_7]HBX49674.1 hypothetical protein [Bacteroidales bacterium]
MFSNLSKKNTIKPYIPEVNIINQYKQIRALGKDHNTKLLKCEELNLDVKGAGKKLNMLEGNTLVFDEEQDMDVLMDYAMYEIYIENKNFVERYYELDLPETTDENLILEAKLEAFTSLFEVINIYPDECKIEIQDILESDNIYQFIDIGFSQTGKIGMLVFTRLIPFPEFYITGGVSFGFKNENKSKLLAGYNFLKFKNNSKIMSNNKYLYFFNQSKILGNKVYTQDIE